MKIKKGDKVKILSGKDKGKIATVIKAYPLINKIVVEGVGIVKKHTKKGKNSKEGGIIKKESLINVSSAMFYDDKLGRPVRLGSKVIDGKKYRVNKITKEVVSK